MVEFKHTNMPIDSYAKELAKHIVNKDLNVDVQRHLAYVITFYGYPEAEKSYDWLCKELER